MARPKKEQVEEVKETIEETIEKETQEATNVNNELETEIVEVKDNCNELLNAANEEIIKLKEEISEYAAKVEELTNKLLLKPNKKEKAFVESEEADDIYLEVCVLHERSEQKQSMAALRLGLIPTQLQVVTNQLNICKNNIARALGK